VKRTRAIISVLLVIVVLALAACAGKSGNTGTSQAQRGGRIVIGQASGPVLTLDPHQSTDRASALVIDSIYGSLLRVGQDSETIEPEVAESYTLSTRFR
jgi:ABC-type transport system substrate-binding protein